jgi:Pathogenicity locus
MVRGRHPDDLQSIPGVGPAIAADLRRLGVKRTADLAGRDPQELFERLEDQAGRHVDRCVLYVFRAAVHYAGGAHGDPELMKWWNWKDGGLAERLGLVWEQRSSGA